MNSNNLLNKYANWQTVTGADYVSMFIKTWFAYIATLSDMFIKPQNIKKGDGWHLSQYRKLFENDLVNQLKRTTEIQEAIYQIYKLGREIVINTKSFREYYFINFYKTTSNPIKFESNYRNTNLMLTLKLHESDDKKSLKLKGAVIYFNNHLRKPFNDNIKIKIVISDIINNLVSKNDSSNERTELWYWQELNDSISNSIIQQIEDGFSQKLTSVPKKHQKNVIEVIKNKSCAFIKEKFICIAKEILELNSKELSEINSTRIIRQKPLENYTSLRQLDFEKTVISDENQTLIKGLIDRAEVDIFFWFLDFVYLLRNALFHEIVNPLDPQWQKVFKNAYIVLQSLVDLNIKYIEKITTQASENIDSIN